MPPDISGGIIINDNITIVKNKEMKIKGEEGDWETLKNSKN